MIVNHHAGSYPIRFVNRLDLDVELQGKLIITDRNVASILGLESPNTFAIEPGEGAKNLETYGQCIDWLISKRVPRSATIYAIGGGVVGDLVGFVAATYMRGVKFVQVPSTLLAMVDSSVGGKVGIDFGPGKNIIGAFKPPAEVLVCSDLLRSLPERQVRSGLAEVLKYGFIFEPALIKTHPIEDQTIKRCIQIKAHVVENDEFETTGLRAILNFGHTIGHALESITQYREFLHGEAISIGMVAEAQLSDNLGLTSSPVTQSVREALANAGLPTTHALLAESEKLIELMMLDKKRTTPGLTFSLLTEVGKCKIVNEVPAERVAEACRKC